MVEKRRNGRVGDEGNDSHRDDDHKGGDHGLLDSGASGLPYSEMAWYALLFGVLAAGCQFADEGGEGGRASSSAASSASASASSPAASEKKLTTRVFVACSFECLRLANFYVQPSLETLQTTLFLEYVIANDNNPGVGFGFLASTVRQAESMGLHLSVSEGRKGAEKMHRVWKGVIQ